MKIIDLLNKIANGEEVPKKIHYNCVPLYWCEPCKIYETITDGELCGKDLYTLLDNLNDEVEIEEEKKIPEKLPIGVKQTKDGIFNTIVKDNIQYELNEKEEIICKKIHEIIDYLKSKGE